MGADIHMYIEYTDKDINRTEKYWRSFGDGINPGRDYLMFGFLTNGCVRYDTNVDGLITPKGLPEGDLSYGAFNDLYMYITKDGNGDNETTMEKALEWNKQFGSKLHYGSDGKTPTFVTCPDWHTKSWLTMKEYKMILKKAKREETIYNVILDTMKSLEKNGYETRLIFWFDN